MTDYKDENDRELREREYRREPYRERESSKGRSLIIGLLIIIALGLFFFIGYGINKQGAMEAQVDSIEDQTNDTRDAINGLKDEYRKDTEAKLGEYDKRINDLEAKSANVGDETKAEYDEAIQSLENQKEAASRKLDEIESASYENWEDFKAAMDATMAELEQRYNELVARFG